MFVEEIIKSQGENGFCLYLYEYLRMKKLGKSRKPASPEMICSNSFQYLRATLPIAIAVVISGSC